MSKQTGFYINRDLFRFIYNEGRANGLLHKELNAHFLAENERKCRFGVNDLECPRVAAYWRGYFDGAGFQPVEAA